MNGSKRFIIESEDSFNIDQKLSGQSALVKQHEVISEFCTKERLRFRRDYGLRLIWFSCIPNEIGANLTPWTVPFGGVRPLKGKVLIETYISTNADSALVITEPKTEE